MLTARKIAMEILNRVQQSDLPLDYHLDRVNPRIQLLERKDRSLVHAMVFGVLRWQLRLDWIIDHLAKRSAKSIDPAIRTILRLGLFQLLYLNRIPEAAAVHTSVELVKKIKRPWSTGFVNTILRRAIRDPLWSKQMGIIHDPVERLAVHHSFPDWLVSRWIARWGEEQTALLCCCLNEIPSVTLRTNTLKTSRQALMAAIQDDADAIALTQYAPEGIALNTLRRPLDQWPAFHDGWFQVQDESSQLVSQLLNPAENDMVWDACTGLGSKTMHLAQIMGNHGRIVASDVQPFKLKRLKSELSRLDIRNTVVCAIDLNGSLPWTPRPIFDRILLDAPCSGLGALQKNPDGKWSTKATELLCHQGRQLLFLTQVAPFLKPGGTLVYSVCSFEPEENEQVVEEFLANHPQFDIHHSAMAELKSKLKISTPDAYLSLWPQRHRLDGFFAAALIKNKAVSGRPLS